MLPITANPAHLTTDSETSPLVIGPGRILQTRRQHGEYHRLVQELRLDGERFQRYFRLDRAQFDELLTRVGPRITRLETNWRSPISAAERLAICLRRNRVFNYRLSRARMIVENTFGILSAQWRMYRRVIGTSPGNVEKCVKATCVLHNFIRWTAGAQQLRDRLLILLISSPSAEWEPTTPQGGHPYLPQAAVTAKQAPGQQCAAPLSRSRATAAGVNREIIRMIRS
ncbi:hypothetical protein AAFF_G00246120 [Aldrovandia affinis]|uniref:DDE Tnp4 domain-containing protein n=1 Tax=Aldrovandia affinis TaxID=143900 RepID=A0AAD7WUJ3_9TELE|nr:hypothetical protein AAFF_G00246120 [Aldrovandia affinis]